MFLSVAPGIDESLLWNQGAEFQPPGPAGSCCEQSQSLSGVRAGVFSGGSESQTAVFNFRFDGTPLVEPVDAGVIVSLDGEQTWVSTGDPVMPVRQSAILLPQGMEITSVEASYLDEGTAIAGGVPLLAAPVAVPLGGSGLGMAGDWVSTVSTPFGEEDAADYSNHLVGGYNVGMLRVFPVEYDAAADTLLYHSDVSVTVTAGPASGGSVAVRGSQSDRLRVAELVDNPGALDGYTDFGGASAGGSSMLPAAGQYDYVIVTGSALESSFEALVEQKISRGLSARIVTTEYVYANYSGTETGDGADKIRHFIADAYANWGTQWVLLGGDSEVVPQRGVYASVESTVDNNLPTDMYYACLDGPWNGDGDGLWGESNDGAGGGDVDLMAEVYVGRAPSAMPPRRPASCTKRSAIRPKAIRTPPRPSGSASSSTIKPGAVIPPSPSATGASPATGI